MKAVHNQIKIIPAASAITHIPIIVEAIANLFLLWVFRKVFLGAWSSKLNEKLLAALLSCFALKFPYCGVT